MSERSVAYGTLDLRIKQGLDVAGMQIEQLSKNKPKEWYFDIIHTPNQTPTALKVLPEVERLIRRFSPRVSKLHRFVHLNTNDKQLRARNELYRKIYEKDITDVRYK